MMQTMAAHHQRSLWRDILIWVKRATGVGYRRFAPLVGNEIDVDKSRYLRLRSDKLVDDVEQLEMELRKIGFRIPPGRKPYN